MGKWDAEDWLAPRSTIYAPKNFCQRNESAWAHTDCAEQQVPLHVDLLGFTSAQRRSSGTHQCNLTQSSTSLQNHGLEVEAVVYHGGSERAMGTRGESKYGTCTRGVFFENILMLLFSHWIRQYHRTLGPITSSKWSEAVSFQISRDRSGHYALSTRCYIIYAILCGHECAFS